MIKKIEKLMKYETAGDPMSDLKWTRKTTEKIADALDTIDIKVSKTTVGKIFFFRTTVNIRILAQVL